MFRTLWTATLVTAALAACKTRQADPSQAQAPAAAPTRTAGRPPAPALPDQPAEPPAGPSSAAAGAPGTEVETRGIAAMQHLADAITADAKDRNCDKVASDLRTFVADNKALIGELVAMQQRATTAPRSSSANRVAAVAIGQSLQTALAACAGNAGVAAAMQGFPAE
jgi:uncharacterized protein (UPF0212 family)